MKPASVFQIKEAVRERDGFRCLLCGIGADEHRLRTGRTLEVHRKTPGSQYVISDCATVCRSCHGPLPKSIRGTYPGGVKIPYEVAGRARHVANHLGIPLAEYLTEVLKPTVERDYRKFLKSQMAEEETE